MSDTKKGERQRCGRNAKQLIIIRRQFKVLLQRNLKLFVSTQGGDIFRLIVLFVGPIGVAEALSWVMGGHFSSQLSMNICALLIMVMAAIYIGTFNSLLTVCNEKQIIKYEFISGVSPSAYILSLAILHFCVCLIQALSFTIVYISQLKLPAVDFLLGKNVTWFVSFLLILFASDMFGLFLSCVAPNGETANFLSPICLIAQMLFSGTLWSMDNFLSHCMIARWGMASLGSLIDMGTIDAGFSKALGKEEMALIEKGLSMSGHTTEELNSMISERMIASSGIDVSIYERSGEHILSAWGSLVLIILVLMILNILIVRLVKYRRR